MQTGLYLLLNSYIKITGGAAPDTVGELSIGDQEGGYAASMQQRDQVVDFWVHDRLAHQRQSAVPHLLTQAPLHVSASAKAPCK